MSATPIRGCVRALLLAGALSGGAAEAQDAPGGTVDGAAPGTAEACPDGRARTVERFEDGAAWDFCWSTRERDGLVLESARWTAPPGADGAAPAPYPVLASGRLGQLHVAYDDGEVTYSDVTQYGLGGAWMQELDASDCPGGRLLEESGRALACLFRADGRSSRRAETGADAGTRSTLFTVSQVGAYTYIVAWHLHADGTLEPTVGASGALQRAGDDVDAPFGRVLAGDPVSLWLSHTHNYHWRLDLDLGARGDDDTFVASAHETAPDGTRARVSRALTTEGAFALDRDGLQAWHLLEAPPAGADPLAGRGYALETPGSGHAFTRPAVEPWSASDIHVTVARDCERHASQNARFFPGCGDDVDAFVDGESVAGADLVVWKRVAFHHVPRNEDRARMHTHWDGFWLRPVNVAGPPAGAPGTPVPEPPAPEASAGGDPDRPSATTSPGAGTGRPEPTGPAVPETPDGGDAGAVPASDDPSRGTTVTVGRGGATGAGLAALVGIGLLGRARRGRGWPVAQALPGQRTSSTRQPSGRPSTSISPSSPARRPSSARASGESTLTRRVAGSISSAPTMCTARSSSAPSAASSSSTTSAPKNTRSAPARASITFSAGSRFWR